MRAEIIQGFGRHVVVGVLHALQINDGVLFTGIRIPTSSDYEQYIYIIIRLRFK